jgi:tetratricopeptide (TPR) repeat protein
MYDTAVALISEAAAIRKNLVGEEHPDYATALNELGDLYVLMGNYDAATALYIQALNIRKKVFGEEHPDYITSLTSLALLNIIQNNITAATGLLIRSNSLALNHIAQTFTSLSEREKIGYAINQSSQFCYLPSLLFTEGAMNPEMLQQVYTNELALKGMALNDQQLF